MSEEKIAELELYNIGIVAGEMVPIIQAAIKGDAPPCSYTSEYIARLEERAIEFLMMVADGAQKIERFKTDFDLSPFLGSDGVDITPYKYFLSVCPPCEEKNMGEFVRVLEKIRNTTNYSLSNNEKEVLKKLADIFEKLSDKAVTATFPFHSPTPEGMEV